MLSICALRLSRCVVGIVAMLLVGRGSAPCEESARVLTIAGTGQDAYRGDGGPATKAMLRQPHSICLNDAGHLYICHIGNHRIRCVTLATGIIQTFAGTGERAATPHGASIAGTPLNGQRALYFSGGDLYLALREGNAVYRLDLARSTLHYLTGTGKQGYSSDGGDDRRPACQRGDRKDKGALTSYRDVSRTDTGKLRVGTGATSRGR